jgi:hypothetical protein
MNELVHTFSTGSITLPKNAKRDFTSFTPSDAIGKLRFFDLWLSEPPNQIQRLGPAEKPALAERLFNATAAAKIWTSRVVMHLDRAARDRFFRQLDRLHDEEEWIGDDLPVNLESYKSFIRAFVRMGIDRGPSLALMPSGNLLAVWQHDSDRLTIEFLPGNRAKWLLSRMFKGEIERAAGETLISRIGAVLAPYGPDGWLIGS